MKHDRKGEEGHLMAALMAAIAIMVIFSMVVFQAWEDVLRRDNEAEMIFRGQEIARAIARYRVDFQDVPRSLEALSKPGPRGQYYLRMRYTDPLVPDGNWGLLFDGPDGNLVDPGSQISQDRLLGFAGDDRLQELSRQRELAPGPRENRGAAAIGRVAGVRTLSSDPPFRVYKGFTEYAQWQFTYHDYEQDDPRQQGRPGGQQRRNPARGARGGAAGGLNPGNTGSGRTPGR